MVAWRGSKTLVELGTDRAEVPRQVLSVQVQVLSAKVSALQ